MATPAANSAAAAAFLQGCGVGAAAADAADAPALVVAREALARSESEAAGGGAVVQAEWVKVVDEVVPSVSMEDAAPPA